MMSEATEPRRGGLGRALRSYPYGEAVLWALFAITMLSGLTENEAHFTAAGLFALAAIGVRATREPRESRR